ncbi:Trypsin-like peptidase domain [Raineya orbicola]|uniref:Trypsin-like peptidase domain n=2 Tax=Raineya orbicola TaxID=2016530 RepID=A0A2N3IA00_9BACT|nr:Trypsin-like peptidase domain [Raineya orbicola]
MITYRKFWIAVLLSGVLGGTLVLLGLRWFLGSNFIPITKIAYRFKDTALAIPEGMNFIYSSEMAIPAVVHIRTAFTKRQTSRYHENDAVDEMFRQFHGRGWSPRSSSGSGVIISEDGYIVTNNHVVENNDLIEVTLHDKRSYEARVIGTDPSTDLALLKIDEEHLPALPFANSDKVRIGEWVLAVGNPFELNSTVTAGIISAKARNINLIQDKDNLQVESFLQTDASVNPGNSGGALVNLRGELIGINTAIASETGVFQGYSFAIPANLVKKVADDLRQYGQVQRALMGVEISDVNAELAKSKKLPNVDGVYVNGVTANGGAWEAGITKGDVILEIENIKVNSKSELQGIIASKRPGDKVSVLFRRNTEEKKVVVTLKNPKGNLEITRKTSNESIQIMGAEIANVSETEKETLNIKNGAKILRIGKGKLADAGVQKGFVITHISQSGKRIAVSSAAHVLAIVQQADKTGDGLYFEGIYENGDKAYYPIGW